MPKKPDKTLKTESGKTYKTQLKAVEKYTGEGAADKSQRKVESVRLRVPNGWGQIIKDYVASSGKYKSVNSMICELIRKEIGIDKK